MDPVSKDIFIPTSPAASTRYDEKKGITPSARSISPGLFATSSVSECQSLPPQWKAYTHPEGNLCFVRSEGTTIVTEAYLYDSDVAGQTLQWVQRFEHWLHSKQMGPLAETVEIFLDPDHDDGQCGYYLVDHSSRTVFWLETVETDELGLKPCVSESHLKICLEEQYWLHVEFFPSHNAKGLRLDVDELIHVLNQGRVDHMTSITSTHSFSRQQLADFVEVLREPQVSNHMSAYFKWMIARLWCNITVYRFLNHHGQAICRLNRDDSIIEGPVHSPGKAYKLLSRLLFKEPEKYIRSLQGVWTDEIVNVHHWHRFISDALFDWKASLAVSFALLLINLLTTLSPIVTDLTWAVISIILCNSAIILSLLTILWHHHRSEETAHQAAAFLRDTFGARFGLETLALQFSLPKSLALWALAASVVEVLLGFLGPLPTYVAFASFATIIGAHKLYLVCSLWVRRWRAVVWRRSRRPIQTSREYEEDQSLLHIA